MDPKRAKRLIANRQVNHDVDLHHVAPGTPHETAMTAPLLAFLSLACGHWPILSDSWAVHQRIQAVINGAPACPQAEQNAIKFCVH